MPVTPNSNTSEMKPTRKGIIVSVNKSSSAARLLVAGHALRWQSEIRWDDSERTDWVDDIHIIHDLNCKPIKRVLNMPKQMRLQPMSQHLAQSQKGPTVLLL